MSGRDPRQVHRAATPLELLFDLTFVIAFGLAGVQLAHFLADGHYVTAIVGYSFAAFGICWAWINYSWFASAYDTDDWIFRVMTMVQMVGVLIFALGLPPMFKSLDQGQYLDNSIMVLGYVVMRVSLILQWLRAAKQDSGRRRVASTYIVTLVVAQAVWSALIFIDLPVWQTFAVMALPVLVELSGPFFAEKKDGGTPWHPHHIAERYGLLAIIALGEGVVGTVASVSSAVEVSGWSLDAVLLCAVGTGLTFGMWWVYFIVPSGELLHRHRERSFFWGYGHIVLFAAIAATGGGLHVAGYYLENKAHIGAVATVLSVAVPVAVYVAMAYLIYYRMTRQHEPFYTLLLGGTAAFLLVAVALAYFGMPVTHCLIAVMCAPLVTVIGFELKGHRHVERVIGAAKP
jgi:low temperature requirement protein LtrA